MFQFFNRLPWHKCFIEKDHYFKSYDNIIVDYFINVLLMFECASMEITTTLNHEWEISCNSCRQFKDESHDRICDCPAPLRCRSSDEGSEDHRDRHLVVSLEILKVVVLKIIKLLKQFYLRIKLTFLLFHKHLAFEPVKSWNAANRHKSVIRIRALENSMQRRHFQHFLNSWLLKNFRIN